MEFFDNSALTTVAGASLAVTVFTAMLKQGIGLRGRPTQYVAMGLSVAIALVFGSCSDTRAILTW